MVPGQMLGNGRSNTIANSGLSILHPIHISGISRNFRPIFQKVLRENWQRDACWDDVFISGFPFSCKSTSETNFFGCLPLPYWCNHWKDYPNLLFFATGCSDPFHKCECASLEVNLRYLSLYQWGNCWGQFRNRCNAGLAWRLLAARPLCLVWGSLESRLWRLG